MKDIFEFNHIDGSLSESDIKTLKDFYSHYHKNTGVSRGLIGAINFLIRYLQSLEYAWWQ